MAMSVGPSPVVDDEPIVRQVVATSLRQEGHPTLEAGDGRTALELIQRSDPGLVVLDVMLPGLDGLEVCRAIRRRSDTPVIMLTARGEEADRILGLDLGADDYVTKPFSPRELVARVAAVPRRTGGEPVPAARPALAIGNVTIDRDRHAVRVGDTELVVTATELRLLATL